MVVDVRLQIGTLGSLTVPAGSVIGIRDPSTERDVTQTRYQKSHNFGYVGHHLRRVREPTCCWSVTSIRVIFQHPSRGSILNTALN